MGAEASCTATFKDRSSAGKALLETNELIFRGDFRLKIELNTISSLEASNGRLKVTWPGGTANFALGDRATAWAEKIRNPRGLIDKLGVKEGQRLVVLHLPDQFISQLRERGASVSMRGSRDADAVFLGAESLAGLSGLRRLVDQIKRDGAIWTVTPKGKTGVKDTDIMGIAKAAGLVALKVVAFSDTHSANKFVIPKIRR